MLERDTTAQRKGMALRCTTEVVYQQAKDAVLRLRRPEGAAAVGRIGLILCDVTWRRGSRSLSIRRLKGQAGTKDFHGEIDLLGAEAVEIRARRRTDSS